MEILEKIENVGNRRKKNLSYLPSITGDGLTKKLTGLLYIAQLAVEIHCQYNL
jgi:hypothetical protein